MGKGGIKYETEARLSGHVLVIFFQSEKQVSPLSSNTEAKLHSSSDLASQPGSALSRSYATLKSASQYALLLTFS